MIRGGTRTSGSDADSVPGLQVATTGVGAPIWIAISVCEVVEPKADGCLAAHRNWHKIFVLSKTQTVS